MIAFTSSSSKNRSLWGKGKTNKKTREKGRKKEKAISLKLKLGEKGASKHSKL